MTTRAARQVALVTSLVALSTILVWRTTRHAVPREASPPFPHLEESARLDEAPRTLDAPGPPPAERVPSVAPDETAKAAVDEPRPTVRACAVWGFLKDSSGQVIRRPSAERWVVVSDAMGRRAPARFRKDEAYCVKPGRVGLHTIEAWARGYERRRVDVVVGDDSQQMDIVLEELSSVPVEVYDLAGRPFTDLLSAAPGGEAEAIKASVGVVLGSGLSVGGSMSIDLAIAGGFTRAFSRQEPARIGWIDCAEIAPGGLDAALTVGSHVVATAQLLEGDALLSFRVDGLLSRLIALEISVLDAEAATLVTEGLISVHSWDGTSFGPLVEGRTTVFVPPGPVVITSLVAGFESVDEHLDIDPSPTRQPVKLELRHTVGIRGTLVLREPGASLEGTSVYLCKADAAGVVRPIAAPYWPEADGAFEFWIGAGHYYVQVRPSPSSPDLMSDYVSAIVSDVPLSTLEVPVSACGALTLINGGAAPVSVRLRRNELVEDIGTLAAGSRTTVQLWPSAYEVEVLEAGGPGKSRPVRVVRGAALELALDGWE